MKPTFAKQKKIKKLTAKKVWPFISKAVRYIECYKDSGTITEGDCYTCERTFLIGDLQGGHLIDGHTGKNYLDFRAVKNQCVQCNVFKHGNKEVYIPKFIKEFGQELYDEILREKEAHKWTQSELLGIKTEAQKIIEKYKALNKETVC